MDTTRPRWQENRYLLWGVLLAAGVIIVIGLATVLPSGIDWRETYRPATRAVFSGRNPYDADIAPNAPFFAAPWAAVILLPLALLPLELGRAGLFVVSLVAFGVTAQRLGASRVGMAAFLLSPPVIHNLINANVEWIPLLGFVLPPQIGLFFIAVKPQTGFAVGIYWLFKAWREGGVREVVRVFGPVTAALLLSFALYGLWPFRFDNVLGIAQDFNASLWPLSIPVGLTLIVAAIRQRRVELAMPASPCLSPYVLFHSWSAGLVALSGATVEMVTAVIGLWLLVLVRALGWG